MKKRFETIVKRGIALCCTIAICSFSNISFADDNITTLEQETTSLQNKLNALNNELNSISSEITVLASQIQETNAAVEKAELDLAAAKLDEEIQYDSMKKRIKFMYETGNHSFLQMLFASESMADFLNNSEFIKNVTEYDREMLIELQESYENVAQKETELKDKQAELEELKTSLDARQNALNNAIASTSGELQASETALANAKSAQETADKATGGASSTGTNSSATSGNSSGSSSNATTNDLVLFAAILQCEAGTSNYDALLAVATVVMNRVESPRYPNTLYGVIYQRGQFSPTWNGSLRRVLSKGPASLCYQVARDALNGSRLASVKNCYSFNAAYSGKPGIIVGGNVFW